ncbi:hypothetical protein SSX86_008648 [Deinandra increscens subsp. villosa]|uniref:F-box domain-containing protein n=1 Tax=Deinandra increscens subsp. villosa TaxID=3103831 RepID=A0AAP0DD32_9ASTR
MTNLLRKVWGSVSTRANSSKFSPNSFSTSSSHVSSLSDQIIMCSSSTGEFDRIPLDVFMQIVKLLQPNEVARLAAVCKLWKLIVFDDKLWMYYLQNQLVPWESISFSEINLRSGFPLQTYTQMESFMNIYGLRAQVPGAIIIDGGSGYCKFGWSKFDSPSGRSATFLEFGNIESPMNSRLRHFFATVYNRMQVKSSTQPVVVSIPLCQYDDTEDAKAARRQLKEAIHSALFGMNVPAVCAVSQATLALFAARRTSGIVVNIGFQQTTIVPILNGKIMRKVRVEAVGVGALKLTEYLREQMQQKNLQFDSLYTVRSLKENLCYVALDYEAELCKDTEASYEVAAAGWFTLARERFQTGEILFQPRIAGMRAMGLHQAVGLCIDHCHAAELTADETWFKTIVLAGGTACLPGVADTEDAKAARRQLKEAIHSALFGMNVPAVCAVSQATLALFAARRTSGIVVNIGFQQTTIVPILNGKIMRKVRVEAVGVGALKLTEYLREQMQQKNLQFDSLYTVRSLKENLCYVALDYEAELCKDTEASYEVAAAGSFTLARERFQTGEILFQPRIAGMRAMGLHQAVGLCIDHCHAAELTADETWFKTIVLAGGTACLPGVAERLEKELHGVLPPSVADGIKVIPPPYGSDSAWYGAKLISNLSTFPNSWCITKKEFRSKARRNLV